jgi:hypothetical protein
MHARLKLVAQLCLGILSLAVAAEEPERLRPWDQYQTIMWIGDAAYRRPEKLPLFFQRLREMGITTAMVYGDGDPQPFLENQFPYYVENMVNRGLCLKFNSNVRDWDKFVTEWAKNGRPESALVRDYCLDDPIWRNESGNQMQKLARKHRGHAPLAYDIRDELSTTISANPFDYDFNPIVLEKFRAWLKSQYGDLASLNTEWETRFGSWAEVRPFTTDQIKNRMASGEALPRRSVDWQKLQLLKFDFASARKAPTQWNFSPWIDFRTYMDISLANALGSLRDAAREVDPRTPVGIEGTQMPHAFGGYDLWRLSQVLDWVEPYDIGNAREILGSFMRHKPLLTTVFETDTKHAQRRLWHLLLEGDRGCLVWWSEDCIDWQSTDYRLTAKANALASALKEMTSSVAQLFLRAERETDPIFIHYSQPSIQVDWLLESTVDGSTWLRRFSSFEAEHNRQAKVRNAWVKAFQDLGYNPRFISSEQIESGGLKLAGKALLVLPSSWALSEKEILAIRDFMEGGKEVLHEVFADEPPGLFDQHGRLRDKAPLVGSAEVWPSASRCACLQTRKQPGFFVGDCTAYGADRIKNNVASALPNWLNQQIEPMQFEARLPIGACTRVHRFRIADGHLVAFERNIDYQMSEELKQAGGNEPLESTLELEAALKSPAHIYDLATQKYLGRSDRIHFTLSPWHPSLFALLRSRVTEDKLLETLSQTSETTK